jgi:environmental stress-induced protein Ves
MKFHITDKKDWIEHSWAGGSTGEVLLLPAGAKWDARDFEIRVSSAVCRGGESVFTDFTGYTRFISPIKGHLKMHHGKGSGETSEVDLAPYEVDRFDGAWKTVSEGAYEDFNLLVTDDFEADMCAVSAATQVNLQPSEITLAGFFCTVPEVTVIVSTEESSEAVPLKEKQFMYFLGGESSDCSVKFSSPSENKRIGFWVAVVPREDL